jgi:hypothetical protein
MGEGTRIFYAGVDKENEVFFCALMMKSTSVPFLFCLKETFEQRETRSYKL